MPDPKTLGGFFAVMAFTVGANLMLKLGAGDPKPTGCSDCSAGSRRRVSLYSVAAGLFMLFCFAKCRSTSLKCLLRRSFIGVVVAASVVLGEPISAARWLGIACISFGITLVGLTANI